MRLHMYFTKERHTFPDNDKFFNILISPVTITVSGNVAFVVVEDLSSRGLELTMPRWEPDAMPTQELSHWLINITL